MKDELLGRNYSSFILPPSSLPYVAQNFPANSCLAGFFVGHDSSRSRQDGDSEAAQDAWDVVAAGIDAQARLADSLEVGDHALALRTVPECDLDSVLLRVFDDFEALDEAFALKDLHDLQFQLASGDL